MHLSSQRCSQVLSNKDRRNGVGKPVIKLASLGSGQLVTQMVCCNGSFLKPAQPMCDGRTASSPFRRLAGRGVFFRGFPYPWVLHLVLSLNRTVFMHDATSCFREDSLCYRVGPCDTLSCFFFSAPWLQRSQSSLVQETPSAKDIVKQILAMRRRRCHSSLSVLRSILN